MGAISEEHKQAIVQAALARGDLRVLMTRTQLTTNRLVESCKAKTFVIECSRRWGKTRYAALRADHVARRQPRAIIRYAAPTKHHGRTFVIPAFDWVAEHYPESQRPKFNAQDNVWVWPNGSKCHLGSLESMADVDGQVGTECHLAIGDEVAKARSGLLKHWHRSVILPQFLTTSGGMCLMLTTPPMSMSHYFMDLARSSAARGTYVKYTVDDCDHINEESRRELVREVVAPYATEWEPWMDDAAKSSPDIRRELYCDPISDPTRMIVPEWQAVAADCVKDLPRQPWLDWYVSADFGFEDLSVVLWGWYDFEVAQLVIEHELSLHRSSGLDVGFAAKGIERELGITKACRVADAPPQLLSDLAHPTHGPGIHFGPAMKDDADAALNQLRMLIQRKRIRIHPRCETLISHLANGTWNANRTSFERVDGYGHWDAIDALKYMVRTIDWQKNPTPSLLPGQSHATHFIPPEISREIAMQRRRAHEVFR